MCEVEEDFAEDGEMAMVEGEVEIAVFAAGGMRIDEHIMQALRRVVFERLWEIRGRLCAWSECCPLIEAGVGRNGKNAKHFETVEVAFPLFCSGKCYEALPDSWGRFAH